MSVAANSMAALTGKVNAVTGATASIIRPRNVSLFFRMAFCFAVRRVNLSQAFLGPLICLCQLILFQGQHLGWFFCGREFSFISLVCYLARTISSRAALIRVVMT
jgi:hypothetical protein